MRWILTRQAALMAALSLWAGAPLVASAQYGRSVLTPNGGTGQPGLTVAPGPGGLGQLTRSPIPSSVIPTNNGIAVPGSGNPTVNYPNFGTMQRQTANPYSNNTVGPYRGYQNQQMGANQAVQPVGQPTPFNPTNNQANAGPSNFMMFSTNSALFPRDSSADRGPISGPINQLGGTPNVPVPTDPGQQQ